MALPTDKRVMNLRRLAQQLEASPPSPERDELLHRTRLRVVEVEASHVDPAALLLPTSQPDPGSSEHATPLAFRIAKRMNRKRCAGPVWLGDQRKPQATANSNTDPDSALGCV